MSKLHHLLPAPLFTLQDAATSGITRNQVVRGGTTRIALQVYALEGYSPPPEELLKLIHCTAPQVVIGSVSAARLLGMRLPPRLQQDSTVYLLQGQSPTRVRRKGVRCSRAVLKPEEVFTVNGVPCTTHERTFFDLAQVLSYRELIAVADGLLVHHEHRANQHVPIRTREQLQKYLRKHPGKRRIKKCRYAVENAVTGSDSYMESLLRCILQDAGVRGLECNVPVYDDFWESAFSTRPRPHRPKTQHPVRG
ncbi:hypothetical protein [Rothia nasisuis]|uniref:hypothetical protein n=1 Tax=Rothia nasisuis TaxID=2109647 RepID=UPI001F234D3B|nr:hypothetical protein [Rothia nasisuis]